MYSPEYKGVIGEIFTKDYERKSYALSGAMSTRESDMSQIPMNISIDNADLYFENLRGQMAFDKEMGLDDNETEIMHDELLIEDLFDQISNFEQTKC